MGGSPLKCLIFRIFCRILKLLFYCLTPLGQAKHARRAVYQISISPYKLHGELVKCDVDDHDGDDEPNFYQTITLAYFDEWRGFFFSLRPSGQNYFCTTFKICVVGLALC